MLAMSPERAVVLEPMMRSERSGFFSSRWHSKVELRLLLWRDVLVVGTLINLMAGFAAFILLTHDIAPIWAVSVHLLPVPYNILLLLSVWRCKQTTPTVSLIATVWFVLMLVI